MQSEMLEVQQQARAVMGESVDKTMMEEQLPYRVAKELTAIRTILEVQQQARAVMVESVDKTMMEEQLPYRVAKELNAIRTMLKVHQQARTVKEVTVVKTMLEVQLHEECLILPLYQLYFFSNLNIHF